MLFTFHISVWYPNVLDYLINEIDFMCIFQMFDRELCCRQLRYSGMMETIRIRRAGYPIRHTFSEFVDRYRFLINGCPPAHKVKDCRMATSRICSAVLGKADYQLGKTKVFLKDAQDLFLEQERDRVLTRKILVLQRCIRGWYARRRFLRMRAAAIGNFT